MQRSETIGELAKALAVAQGEIQNAKKDSDNPFFKSKYADLASVREACQEPLSKNGLAVIQSPRTEITDHATIIYVSTLLAHSSGEWISEELSAIPTKSDPQGIGSCITYLRRYALAAAVGVAPEEDDGNAASRPSESKPTTKAPAKNTPSPMAKGAETTQLKKAVVDVCQMLNKAGDTPPWTAKRVSEFSVKEFGVEADVLELKPLRELVKRLSLRLDDVKKASKAAKGQDFEAAEKAKRIADIREAGDELIEKAFVECKIAPAQLETLPLDALIVLDEFLQVPF